MVMIKLRDLGNGNLLFAAGPFEKAQLLDDVVFGWSEEWVAVLKKDAFGHNDWYQAGTETPRIHGYLDIESFVFAPEELELEPQPPRRQQVVVNGDG